MFYPDDSGGTVLQRGEAPPSVMTRKIESSGSIEELTIRVDERGVTAVEPFDPLLGLAGLQESRKALEEGLRRTHRIATHVKHLLITPS